MKTFSQDPSEKLDYRQTLVGDEVDSASWAISPSTGVTLGTPVNGATSSTVRVSNLTSGTRCVLTAHLVGKSGQEFQRSCIINCTQR